MDPLGLEPLSLAWVQVAESRASKRAKGRGPTSGQKVDFWPEGPEVSIPTALRTRTWMFLSVQKLCFKELLGCFSLRVG